MNAQLLPITLPVMRRLNGNLVGHPRAMLHVKVDPRNSEADCWKVSFSVPGKIAHERFERYFAKTVRENAFTEESGTELNGIDAQRAKLARMIEANGVAIGLGNIAEAWLNETPQKRRYFDQLCRTENASLIPFPMLEKDVEDRKRIDPTMEWESVESVENELERLIELRNKGIELARRDRTVVDAVLQKYLAGTDILLGEGDRNIVLDELMRDMSESAEIIALESQRDAARLYETPATELTTYRIFIDISTILKALKPSNAGRAVIENDCYACFPPARELTETDEPWQYLEYNVVGGLVGAKVQTRSGERWILLAIDRNTLIGILAGMEEYLNRELVTVVLEASGAL